MELVSLTIRSKFQTSSDNFTFLVLLVFMLPFLFLCMNSDGSTQAIAGCLRDFRNKPFPTRARVEYYKNTLTVSICFSSLRCLIVPLLFYFFNIPCVGFSVQVMFHSGMTASDQEYEMCLRAENVMLPKNGYFGLSAATGGLADDHDVLHFLTSSLHAPGQIPTPQAPQVNEEDQRKLTEEYADYQRKLEQQKEV